MWNRTFLDRLEDALFDLEGVDVDAVLLDVDQHFPLSEEVPFFAFIFKYSFYCRRNYSLF